MKSASVRRFASAAGAILGVSFAGARIAPAQTLYVLNASDTTIEKISPDGVDSLFASNAIFAPIALAYDPAGNLYVLNADKVSGQPAAGTIAKIASRSEERRPLQHGWRAVLLRLRHRQSHHKVALRPNPLLPPRHEANLF